MKKIMLLTLALGMMSFEIASADVTNYNIELRDGKYTVSGLADENSENITLEIINGEYTFDKGPETDVILTRLTLRIRTKVFRLRFRSTAVRESLMQGLTERVIPTRPNLK